MNTDIKHLIDFNRVNALLEGFNKTTGFVTAILDLEGTILSKSGWRQICTDFHRVNKDSVKRCIVSDTVLANKMSDGEKYNFYQCLNGLIDVAVPIIINGEHVANLFSGQFFFEKPDLEFFKQQAKTFGFDEDKYLEALSRVPVFSREKVKTAMDFLLDMTRLISQLAYKKQVQQALNKQIIENEQLFKSVFESANAGKSITKLTGEINVNQAFCDMLGYTKKELQNKKWQDLTPADEVPAILTNLDPLLKGEKDSARFEKRYICKNGSWIWTDVSVSIRRDKDGKPLHFITTIIDISDRKQTREALQQAHDRLAKTVSITPGLVYSFKLRPDGSAIFPFGGDRIAEYYGIPHANLENDATPFLELIHPDDYFSMRKSLEESSKQLTPWHHDWRILHPVRGEMWIEGQSMPMREPDGSTSWYGVATNITERKKSEKKLIDSELRYRSLFENMNSGFVLFEVVQDENGMPVDLIIKAANVGFEETTGLNLKDSADRNLTDVLPGIEKDEADWIGTYSRVALTGEPFQFEQGSELLGSYYSVSAFQAAPNQCAVTFVDITERRKTEIRLADSEERLRLATEQANVAVWEYDFNTNSMSRSENHDKLYGMERQQKWDINTFLNATYPDDREYSNQFIQNSVAPGGPDNYAFDFRVVFPDKSIHWLHVNGRVIERNAKGQGLRVRGTLIDITEQKQTELALRESEARYRNILKAVPVGIAIFQHGKIVFSNPAGMQIIGAESLDQIIGKEIGMIIHPEYLEESQKKFYQLMKNKKAVNPVEVKYVRLDGSVIDVEMMTSFLSYQREPAVQIMFTDITERKRLREDLEKLNTDLEMKVKQRTALLEASNNELEAFSYSVSHDLRAPLRHINGYVDLLNQRFHEELPDKARHYLETISGASRHMGILIDDLLQFSRTGRQEVRKTSFNMNDLVNEIVNKMESETVDRKIVWDIQKLPEVFGDYNLLKQVWINLIDNAVKYTRNEKISKISIFCKEEYRELIFCVCDNGVGFDMKYAHKLFGVFQRLHSQSEFEGTGIGLANVQRIVHKHMGRVWAEAQLNKGAKFYFSLPKI